MVRRTVEYADPYAPSVPMTFTHRGRTHQLTTHPRHGSTPPAGASLGIRMVSPSGKRGWHSLHTSNEKDAIRRAKDLLDTAATGPEAWTTHAEINHRRAGLTFAPLVAEYLAAGCPRLRARTLEPRTGRSLADERRNLDTALAWWGQRTVAACGPRMIDDYAAARAAAPRAAELELNALSNALKYAVRRERIPGNPLAGRGAIRPAGSIVHCHAEAPASTEELHALCRVLLADPRTSPYGAQLMFQALTGLRPGEPGHLRWDAPPGQPGSRSTLTADGQTFDVLHVHREKHGINPAVRIHPALDDFLRVWRQHVGATSPFYFPHPRNPDLPAVPAGNAQGSFLDKALKRAAATIGVAGNRRPHAMRAFYVRVRRSMGALDSTIASELGERTGERLIVSTYGDPAGLRGDGKFTWLPATGAPAWSILEAAQPSNVIHLIPAVDTHLDTLSSAQNSLNQPTPAQVAGADAASAT